MSFSLRGIGRKVVAEYAKDSEAFERLVSRCELDDALWRTLKEGFGYAADKPGVEDFCLELLANACTDVTGEEPTMNGEAVPLADSLDVDDFKAQNDTYGHSFGDTCLTAVADQIRRTFGEFGHCYRTGGDEFVVVMTDAPGNLESTCEDFARALDELRERDARIPTVSVGTARHEGAKLLWDCWNADRTARCHSFGKVEFADATDPTRLLALTRLALAEAMKPRASYETGRAGRGRLLMRCR